MTEEEFQSGVIDFAQAHGWRVAHFRPAKTERGWRTAVSADGKGYVDLTLVRERVVFAELKGDRGQLGPEQREWISALVGAGQEVYVWRPKDWPEIEEVLKR